MTSIESYYIRLEYEISHWNTLPLIRHTTALSIYRFVWFSDIEASKDFSCHMHLLHLMYKRIWSIQFTISILHFFFYFSIYLKLSITFISEPRPNIQFATYQNNSKHFRLFPSAYDLCIDYKLPFLIVHIDSFDSKNILG